MNDATKDDKIVESKLLAGKRYVLPSCTVLILICSRRRNASEPEQSSAVSNKVIKVEESTAGDSVPRRSLSITEQIIANNSSFESGKTSSNPTGPTLANTLTDTNSSLGQFSEYVPFASFSVHPFQAQPHGFPDREWAMPADGCTGYSPRRSPQDDLCFINSAAIVQGNDLLDAMEDSRETYYPWNTIHERRL
jgi:hypothetical protein